MKQKKHITTSTTRTVVKKLTYFTDSGEAIESERKIREVKIIEE